MFAFRRKDDWLRSRGLVVPAGMSSAIEIGETGVVGRMIAIYMTIDGRLMVRIARKHECDQRFSTWSDLHNVRSLYENPSSSGAYRVMGYATKLGLDPTKTVCLVRTRGLSEK